MVINGIFIIGTNIITTVYFLFGFLCLLHGQSSSNIENIDWELDEARGLITITYDLNKIDHYGNFDIFLTAILDGRRIELRNLMGDVGSYIETGRGKKIEWKFFEDTPNGLKGILQFEITASNGCVTADTAIVGTDTQPPQALLLKDSLALTCKDTVVQLDGSNSLPSTGLIFR